MKLDDLDSDSLNAMYDELEAEGRAVLDRSGVPADRMTFRRAADMRYEGQGHEIMVPLQFEKMSVKTAGGDPKKVSEDAYRAVYQRLGPNVPVEALNWRLMASGETPDLDFRPVEAVSLAVEEARKPSRSVYFPNWEEMRVCDISDRTRLTSGAAISGPGCSRGIRVHCGDPARLGCARG